MLEIPKFVNNYNTHLNGVDRGDQLHAASIRSKNIKPWKALFDDSIQVMLGNAYLLSNRSSMNASERFTNDAEFKKAAAEAIIARGGIWGYDQAKSHVRFDYYHQGNFAVAKHASDFHCLFKMGRGRCAVCSRKRKLQYRGLASGRGPLRERDINTLPRLLSLIRAAASAMYAYINEEIAGTSIIRLSDLDQLASGLF